VIAALILALAAELPPPLPPPPPAPPRDPAREALLHPATCPPAEVRQPTPQFPDDVPMDAPTSTSFVLITVDTCGSVVEAVLEKGSGFASFDREAVRTTKSWRLAPTLENDGPVSRVFRVPVKFFARTPEEIGRAREQWRRMQHAVVPLDADGKVPGNLPDPLPMEAGSFEEIVARVRREAEWQPGEFEQVEVYLERQGLEMIAWDLFVDMDFGPALLRRRVVTDGTKSFFIVRGMCGSPDPQQCALFEQFLSEAMLPRDPLPVLPSPFLSE